MTQSRKPVPEAGIHDLLDDEIGRLMMRADRIERHEVEAVVKRVKPARAGQTMRPVRSPKETVS